MRGQIEITTGIHPGTGLPMVKRVTAPDNLADWRETAGVDDWSTVDLLAYGLGQGRVDDDTIRNLFGDRIDYDEVVDLGEAIEAAGRQADTRCELRLRNGYLMTDEEIEAYDREADEAADWSPFDGSCGWMVQSIARLRAIGEREVTS